MFCNRPISHTGTGPWGNIEPDCLKKPKSIYLQVKELSSPIIKMYRDDLLKHDRSALTKDKGKTPFLHFTGETGTHLYFLFPADYEGWPKPGEIVPYLFGRADRRHILNEQRNVIHAMDKHHWKELILYWNGRTLKQIDMDRAKEIADTWHRHILNAWNI